METPLAQAQQFLVIGDDPAPPEDSASVGERAGEPGRASIPSRPEATAFRLESRTDSQVCRGLPSGRLWKVLSKGKISEQVWGRKDHSSPQEDPQAGAPSSEEVDRRASRGSQEVALPGSPLPPVPGPSRNRSSPEETLCGLDVNNSRVRGWDTWRRARSGRRGFQRRGRRGGDAAGKGTSEAGT